MSFGTVSYSGGRLEGDAFEITSLVSDRGYEPKVSFAEGIKKTAAWMREND